MRCAAHAPTSNFELQTTIIGSSINPASCQAIVAAMDSSRRLHISWGLGNELHMVDVLPISSLSAPGSSGSSSRESTASVVHW